ncbi:MAG: carbamoyl-phosphate synthase large subunit, partial [Candidatus Eremiobacteraeota bacterium]|nr:carbamoyl-phosphate synthase large subunit [Candidatus Eremiobacteraeota bacterium]
VISKATGINLVAAATRIALGQRLRDLPYGIGLRPHVPFVVVKVPVFSFAKMRGVETILGPEMKSTGEVLGIDETFPGALRKAFEGAGIRMPRKGGRILVALAPRAVEDRDLETLRRYVQLGYELLATPATFPGLQASEISAERTENAMDLVAARAVDLVINTVTGTREATDGYRMRRVAAEANIACITSIDTAAALAHALEHPAGPPRSLQEYHELAKRIA